jgi:outer membrane protein assembly factor BamB
MYSVYPFQVTMRIVLGVAGHLYALSAVNGSRMWSLSTGGPVSSSPTLSSDGSVVFIGAWDGVLLAVRPADGSLVWRTALGSGAGDLGLSSAVQGPNGACIPARRCTAYFQVVPIVCP